jgi:hypothetical protein
MLYDHNDYMIVDGVIGLSKAFGRNIVAEGVETTEHGLMLLLMGCENAQGYAISRPLPAGKFFKWLYEQYEAEPQWLAYSSKNYTPQETQINLLLLAFNAWTNLFKENIYSPSHEAKTWPTLNPSQNLSVNWVVRVKHSGIFNSDWLNQINETIETSLKIAKEIQLLYMNDEIDLGRQQMVQFEQSTDKLLNLVSNIAK